MAVKYWHRTSLTGGVDASLDNIDGALLSDGDIAYVVTSSYYYVYYLNATSGAAESSPDVIAPDRNAGNKRWKLVGVYGAVLPQNLDTTDSPTFATVKLSGLADGKIPYHVDDATGLADGPTKTDVDDAVSKKHSQNTDTGTDKTSFTIDSGGSIVKKAATKTSDTLSKTIGSGGDYADFATAIAAVPDLLGNQVTLTIKAGTTLAEDCSIYNKHGLNSLASLHICAEKHYPPFGYTDSIPTADSATASTLVDAALAAAVYGDDYFNECWVIIVHGTGTDNGYVKITDYTDATGTISVASWPGTQPDNTSKYMIVGALVGAGYNLYIQENTIKTYIYGIGVYDSDSPGGIYVVNCTSVDIVGCAAYACDYAGIFVNGADAAAMYNVGIVGCNTSNSTSYGGIKTQRCRYLGSAYCLLNGNSQRGYYITQGGYAYLVNAAGVSNGTWGTYASDGATANCSGTECSGSSGDHSNGAGDGSLAY